MIQSIVAVYQGSLWQTSVHSSVVSGEQWLPPRYSVALPIQ